MSYYEERGLKIAIDGPAGAGKSTVARELARRLKLTYLDTGAMYRAITLKLIRENISLENTALLDKTVRETALEIKPGDTGNIIFLDGEDVTAEIRLPHINKFVSQVAAVSRVRKKMVSLQQEIARREAGIVMEGRDISSTVIPDAGYKFYLDASLAERSRRRWKEQTEKGEAVVLEDVLQEIETRDSIDSRREDSPLTIAPDVKVINTTNSTIEQVVEKILFWINKTGVGE